MSTKEQRERAKEQRDHIRARASWLSAGAAVLSVFFAYKLGHDHEWCTHKATWGSVLIGMWAIAPPVWFFVEYARWPPEEGYEDERARHFHDLARNIWLALIVILGVAMRIPWPGSGM